MRDISTAHPHPSENLGAKIFRVGTLAYTQQQLYVLFFWLMWNDFMITFLQDPIGFGNFLQKDHGATNTQIALFGVVATIMNIVINPVFSVWSDRTRTPWGRRRPFLLIFTPPLALFIMVMPYMPTLAHYLLRFPSLHPVFNVLPTLQHQLLRHPWSSFLADAVPTDHAVVMVGLCTLAIGFFNSIVGTLFSYLYWDVVPQEVLGRWTAMVRIVGFVAGFVWQFFFLGMADHHMKALCIGVSIFSLAVYLLSVWKVKEGGYAPVDRHVKGGPWFASIRAYFVENFSDSYFLWIFAGFAFASINWGTGTYIGFYLRYNLGLDYDQMGKMNAWPGLVAVLLGYFFGVIADRLHPLRVFILSYFALGIIYVGAFLFIHDKWSYLIWSCVIAIGQFANGITYGALLPQIFPREKFGQFCSANAACSAAVNLLLTVPIAWMFDDLHSSYRYAYLIAAFSMIGAGAVFIKVYLNFEARNEKAPVPHAG
jgi:maltose/moltooligosaccharide transporter